MAILKAHAAIQSGAPLIIYKMHQCTDLSIKAEDIATEKSVALKDHKYVIDTVGVTKSHRLRY